MEFEELKTTRKGNLGEAELDKYLIENGIIPYFPVRGVAHPFDRLCATTDKKNLFIAECKTKASRKYYPDTGINIKSYDEYKFITNKYGIDVYLYFVDEYKKSIYGNLTELEKPRVANGNNYPLRQGVIIYFPLIAMIEVCKLTDAVAKDLRELSSRSYTYD